MIMGGGAGIVAASIINCLMDCFLTGSLNSGRPVMYANGPRRTSTGLTGFGGGRLLRFWGILTHPSFDTTIGMMAVEDVNDVNS